MFVPESFRHFNKASNEPGKSRKKNLLNNCQIKRKLYHIRFSSSVTAEDELEYLSQQITDSKSGLSKWYPEMPELPKPI